MIDLELLRSFVAVAETEHVGRAAKLLHISQSPLSRQIRQLEDQFGLGLFHRERQRVRLTEAGRWLLAESRELLGRAERVERDAAHLARGETGGLAIGFVKTALWSGVIPKALREFQEAHPRVQLELRAGTSDTQVRAVQGGTLDVGLVHRIPQGAEVARVHLFDEPALLALPSEHPLAKREVIRPEDLRDQVWIGLSHTLHPSAHAAFVMACDRAGFVPEVRYQTGDRATVLGLVESGLGLALVPASARRVVAPGLTLREVAWLSLATRLYLIHQNTPSAAARQFAEVAIARAREPGGGAGP